MCFLYPAWLYCLHMIAKPAHAAEHKAEDRAAYMAAVDEGLADAKAERIVPYEKVRRWLLSWGSSKESSPPNCP
jgi:predicted transcriptional regulator